MVAPFQEFRTWITKTVRSAINWHNKDRKSRFWEPT